MRVSLALQLPVLPEAVGRKHLDFDFPGTTVGDLLDHLVKRYGKKARDAMYDENGALDPVIQIVVNGKDWLKEEHLDTPLKEGDQVVLMALLAGG
jgi:MoaD family protein